MRQQLTETTAEEDLKPIIHEKGQVWRPAAKFFDILVRFEQLFMVWSMVIILFAMGSQVIARYVFRSPLYWSEELALFALVWLVFVAAALVLEKQNHIAVDVISGSRFIPKFIKNNKHWMEVFVNLVITFVCFTMFLGGLRFVVSVHPVASPSIGIPKSLWYGGASTGFLLMGLHSGWHLIKLLLRENSASTVR